MGARGENFGRESFEITGASQGRVHSGYVSGLSQWEDLGEDPGEARVSELVDVRHPLWKPKDLRRQ